MRWPAISQAIEAAGLIGAAYWDENGNPLPMTEGQSEPSYSQAVTVILAAREIPVPVPKMPSQVWVEVQALSAQQRLLFARRCVSRWFGVPLSLITETPDASALKERLKALLLDDPEAFQSLVRFAANLPNWSVYQGES